MNNNEVANEELFENNLLAVDKYLATINTADGKMGVGEHYLSQMWCRGLAQRVAPTMTARREQILVHSYIQIHAQFFVQILVVKLIAQILCTFSLHKCTCSTHMMRDRQAHAAANLTKSALAEEANLFETRR